MSAFQPEYSVNGPDIQYLFDSLNQIELLPSLQKGMIKADANQLKISSCSEENSKSPVISGLSQQHTTDMGQQMYKGKRALVKWEPAEDAQLFQNYQKKGSKWIEIANTFPTKNDNDIKNRFYACIRRLTKSINGFLSKFKTNPKRSISIGCRTLLTILELGKFNDNSLDKRFIQIKKNYDDLLQAKKMIIDLACKPDYQQSPHQLEVLAVKLGELKYCLKFINFKRVKQSAVKEYSHTKDQSQSQPMKNYLQESAPPTSIKPEANISSLQQFEQLIDRQQKKPGSQPKKTLLQQYEDILCPQLIANQKHIQQYFL